MAKRSKIDGMSELQGLFDRLEKVPQRIATRSARKGGVIALRAARSNAPVDEGHLKKGLVLRKERTKIKGRAVYQVTFDRNMNDHFVSNSKHTKDKKGRAKRGYYPASQEYGFMTKDGKYIPGYRYMRRAADDNKETIEKEILNQTGKEIDKELGKG